MHIVDLESVYRLLMGCATLASGTVHIRCIGFSIGDGAL